MVSRFIFLWGGTTSDSVIVPFNEMLFLWPNVLNAILVISVI